MMTTKMVVDFDPYALLHVPYNATEQCIQSAYRQQARVWHPDKNPGNAEQGTFYASARDMLVVVLQPASCS